MRVYRLNFRRATKFILLLPLFVLVAVILFRLHHTNRERSSSNAARGKNSTANREFRYATVLKTLSNPYEKIDWHDHEFIRNESSRQGIGEQGKLATLPPNHDKSKCDEDEVFNSIGYNGCLSDYISVNRSLPDTRPPDCQKMKYRRHLPSATVIIPVYNEHFSVLLRAVHSILNRSPRDLLNEIILVDDYSSTADMKERLDDYVSSNLQPRVRILRITSSREGLMAARLLGANNASGEVLVFLDSNLEVNINWLPPLLEVIAENYRACVCPVIDVINPRTFEIQRTGEGFRGAFDWELIYRYFPLLPEDRLNKTKPFKSPIMVGCAFAISSRFFWELGGYDTGLKIWGGEQYELSFKVWQCWGIQLDVPCSRVGHLYRGTRTLPYGDSGHGDYVGKNFKRVAEVWMDEYAQYLYAHKPSLNSIDPGDLREQREVRQRLNCKPFKWFMEEVAFDVLRRYPGVDPPDYGSGKIVSHAHKNSCLTVVNNDHAELLDCFSTENEHYRQEFLLSWHKDIEVRKASSCLTAFVSSPKHPINTHRCRRELGDQVWRYNMETQQIEFKEDGKLCLASDLRTTQVYLDFCDKNSETQKWVIDYVNVDALKKWNETEPFM